MASTGSLQPVVVDSVLVPERDAEDALADQGRNLVLDPLRHARVAAARSEAADQSDGTVRRAKQQRASVRGDRTGVKGSDHAAALDGCNIEPRWATFCPHRGSLLPRDPSLPPKSFRRSRTPMHLPTVRYPG